LARLTKADTGDEARLVDMAGSSWVGGDLSVEKVRGVSLAGRVIGLRPARPDQLGGVGSKVSCLARQISQTLGRSIYLAWDGKQPGQPISRSDELS
jgi:hypothetical protein